MKECDIKVGVSYLFAVTDVEHRKSMIGTIVTVEKIRAGKRKSVRTPRGIIKANNPMRIKLTNGQSAKAAELKPITP